MRILISHEVTSFQQNFIPPTGKNPIEIGGASQCDVRLTAGTIPALAASIMNAGDGEPWQLRTRCDRVVFQDAPLADNAVVPLQTESVFYIYPYWITVYLEQADSINARDITYRQLEAKYSQLVLAIHRKVMQKLQQVSLMDAGGAQPDEAVNALHSESFLLDLENAIDQEAIRSTELPADDLSATPMGDHLAGIYCRTLVLGSLVKRLNQHEQTAAAPPRFWATLRSMRPDLERMAERLTESIIRSMHLDQQDDLTHVVRKLDAGFRSVWRKTAERIPRELRRYLALAKLKKEIKDNWYGYGPLEDLLEDPNVTEIMVNDAEHIFVEKNHVIEDSGRRFLNDLQHVIDRIVAQVHRKVDTSTPMVDARLPDGSRVNAIIAPLTVGGPALTIRRFPAEPLSWAFLVDHGSLTEAALAFLRAAVQIRTNILVSGGTATGKTTLLNALSEFIGDRERIITIEDTAELRLRNRHVVQLETKPKNIEGTGEVSIRMLLKNALRMRPDRIIVGECRGGEALDMLQAMNTGHDGSMTTIHANHPRDVISRLDVMVQQSEGSQLPIEAIHRQIVSAVDLIVQLTAEQVRPPGMKELRRHRVISEISEVVSVDAETGDVVLKPLFQRPHGGVLRPTGRLPSFIERLVAHGFDLAHLKKLS